MAIALEPGEPGIVWLERYDEVPLESRRVVEFTALSIRQTRQLARDYQSLWDSANSDEQLDKLIALFAGLATGWRNYPVPYSREVIEDQFTKDGLFEIMRHVMAGSYIGLDDKKK